MMGNKTRGLTEVGINTVLCCLVRVTSTAVGITQQNCTDPFAGTKHVGFSMQSTYVLCWHTVTRYGYSIWRERVE